MKMTDEQKKSLSAVPTLIKAAQEHNAALLKLKDTVEALGRDAVVVLLRNQSVMAKTITAVLEMIKDAPGAQQHLAVLKQSQLEISQLERLWEQSGDGPETEG